MVRTASTMPDLGTPAPDFALADTLGHIWRLEDFADAPVLVVMFICNHCPYVHHVRNRLAKVTAGFMERGVAVVGINSNDPDSYPEESEQNMVLEVESVGYQFPYLIDITQDVARRFRAACTPDFFVYGAERKLIYRGQFDASRPSSGTAATGADLVAAVEAALGGYAPLGDQWPSMGCNIKWRPGSETG